MEQMDQNLAKRLFFEGGIFILLNVPKGTAFGIDMNVWNTDENFRGMKMIPPGLHFVHYSAVNKMGDQAPRSGFFHNFKKSEFLVKYYDKTTEDISNTPVSESEIAELRYNLIQLDKFLAPYPYEVYETWSALTKHLHETLVTTLSPTCGFIYSVLALVPCNNDERPRGQQNAPKDLEETSSNYTKRKRLSGRDTDLLPDLKPVPGTEIRFTKFPERNYPEDSTPAEITKHSLDSTYVLETMLQRYENILDFIGEIQFSFVCFLVGHSLEGFEHWKDLVGLLCSCEDAIINYRELYDSLIPVLEIQLNEIPEEFLADIVSNNNFVYCKLRRLFRAVQDSDVDGRLKTKISRFRHSLTKTFQWDFSHLDDDDEDEAPVIVEL